MRYLATAFFFCVVLTSAAAKDACSLMTADDVHAAIGEAVQKVPPGMIPPSAPGLEYSSCNFKALAGKTRVSLLARYSQNRPNDSAQDLMAKLRTQGYQGIREISGVGDGAVWANLGTTHQLTVMKGKGIFLLITISGPGDEATALQHAKSLAAKILPHA